MDRPLIVCALLITYSTSIAQMVVANETHPFQVLFVDSARHLDKPRQVHQFDFINKYDLIENYGSLIVVHYSGKVLELQEQELRFREISKKHVERKPYRRPVLSDPSSYVDSSLGKLKEEFQGVVIIERPTLDLFFPFHQNDFSYKVELPMTSEEVAFELPKAAQDLGGVDLRQQYFIQAVNIYEDPLFDLSASNAELVTFPVSVESLEEKTMILKIQKGLESYVPYAIVFTDTQKYTKYEYLLEAFHQYWLGRKKLAAYLSEQAVSLSAQENRFMLLHQSFFTPEPASE